MTYDEAFKISGAIPDAYNKREHVLDLIATVIPSNDNECGMYQLWLEDYLSNPEHKFTHDLCKQFGKTFRAGFLKVNDYKLEEISVTWGLIK